MATVATNVMLFAASLTLLEMFVAVIVLGTLLATFLPLMQSVNYQQRLTDQRLLALREAENLRRVGREFSGQASGSLSIATTHTQARYVLPKPVSRLRAAYPEVTVSLHQGSPDQVARMVIEEVAERL